MRNSLKLSRLVAVCCLIVVALLGACRSGDPSVPEVVLPTRSFTDDLGRDVKLPEKVDRVISLAPSMTEIIFEAGGGEKLVGVTTYCDFPKEVGSIEKIGDTQTPNIERIIALDPDVVFVSTASQLEAFMSALEQRSIAVFVVNVRSFDDLFRNVKVVGEILGTEEVATGNVVSLSGRESFIRHQIIRGSEIESGRPEKKSPRVFVQISNEPLFTIGKDSFLTEVVSRAGGESVTKDVPSGYPKLSKETASAMDPDVIILSDSEDNREPNVVFKNSNAVKNGRVYRINADIISRPGPRLVDALEQIAGFLNR